MNAVVRRTSGVWLVATVLIGLGVLALALRLRPTPLRGPISLTFTGMGKVVPSSDAPAGEVAYFELRNGAPTEILYWVESVEYRTADGWITNTLGQTPRQWRQFGAGLGPHESRAIHIPPPTNGVWRLRLRGNERATGIKGFFDRVRDHLDSFTWRSGSLTAERFEGRSLEILSNEVQRQ